MKGCASTAAATAPSTYTRLSPKPDRIAGAWLMAVKTIPRVTTFVDRKWLGCVIDWSHAQKSSWRESVGNSAVLVLAYVTARSAAWNSARLADGFVRGGRLEPFTPATAMDSVPLAGSHVPTRLGYAAPAGSVSTSSLATKLAGEIITKARVRFASSTSASVRPGSHTVAAPCCV